MKNKEKLTKEEKKQLKAKNSASESVKICAVKCVSVVVCTCMVCGSAFSCSKKYADVIKNTPQNSSISYKAPNNAVPTVSDSIDYDVQTPTEKNEQTVETPSTPDSVESTSAASGNKEMTVGQIIEKFNTASNKIKGSCKSITQNYCENSQVSTPEINNKTLKTVADKLINSNMGRDKKKSNVVYSSAEDKINNYPISGKNYTAKLTVDDVKSATITKSGNISSITIKVKDDLTPNTGTHAMKAFSVVTKDQIVKGAGSIGMKFIKEESIGLSYSNGVIKVKIDERTGNVISANYYIEWKLVLSTTIGLDVGISFGLEEDYTINW